MFFFSAPKSWLFISLFFLSITPCVANASSPLSGVGGASVTAGLTQVEARAGFTQDDRSTSNDNRIQTRQHIDHGFNDWYALRLVVAQDKREGDNLEHRGITLENRFQLIEKSKHGWDGGLRLQYTQADGDKTPHEIDFRIMTQVPFNNTWEWRQNTVLEHDIGADMRHGVHLEFRNQVTAPVTLIENDNISTRLGLEMINDFGRLRDTDGYDSQNHQIGPVLKAKFDNGVYIETGYRAGMSQSGTDHTYKFFIGKSF